MTEKEYREHPYISRSELWKMSESPKSSSGTKKIRKSQRQRLYLANTFTQCFWMKSHLKANLLSSHYWTAEQKTVDPHTLNLYQI